MQMRRLILIVRDTGVENVRHLIESQLLIKRQVGVSLRVAVAVQFIKLCHSLMAGNVMLLSIALYGGWFSGIETAHAVDERAPVDQIGALRDIYLDVLRRYFG